jgi:threonine/homoserine/homoserine lactone efflux protein
MLSLETLLALTLFAAVSSLTPGPNNVMLMSSGTRFGFMPTIPHLLGVTLGFVFMIVCVGAGLMRMFEIWPALHGVLKTASVIYLLWLAWKIASAPVTMTPKPTASDRPLTFLQAALFQWLNPKAWTMALGALSAYVPVGDRVSGVLLVAAVFGVVNLPSCATWAAMGVQLRRFMSDPVKLRLFNRTMATVLVASLVPVALH